jgi:tRNA(Ile)-lysidine synthase
MPTPLHSLLTKLAAAWPRERWHDVTVLVAVSGGADSVALARALAEVQPRGEGRLILAHFNHRLRGAESDADQAFVESLANQLGLKIVIGLAPESPPLPLSPPPSQPPTAEAALRGLRYVFLEQAANQTGARYVATAHTADDQVETVLHNLLRGTGLAGLAGIPRLRQLTLATTLIRPLLDVTRAEVLDYLRSLGQPFREDSSNQTLDYTRNRLRHELLPLLERDFNPRVREALLRLSKIAGQTGELLDQQAEALLRFAARPVPGGVELDLANFEGTHPALVRHVLLLIWQRQGWPLQDMSAERWEQLLALARAPAPPPQMFPGGIRAENQGGIFRLSRE